MTLAGTLQPDQQPRLWDNHVSLHEEVFEPLSQVFALSAMAGLALPKDAHILDSGAGTGGAALELARRGARVTAIDASPQMIERIKERAAAEQLSLEAYVMDGQHLRFPDATFSAALSIFGVILFPDAAAGLAELRRVVRPGGCIALATWTEPAAYELAAELRAAAVAILGALPPSPLPAQLRFHERAQFQGLFQNAGLSQIRIETVEASLEAPSAGWLVERLSFAPGMDAMLNGFGTRKVEILGAFRSGLESRFGGGQVSLKAKAFICTGQVPDAEVTLHGKSVN